jgi:carboxyl-terminal processing protease
MITRSTRLGRPVTRVLVIVIAFAAGVLVERYQRLLAPYDHAPHGLEKTFRPFWETWDLADKYYVDHDAVQPERMTRSAIDGMLASLGDYGHTSYLSKSEFEQLERTLAGNLEGIGVRMVVSNGRPTITNTLVGSPARAAGMKAGDVMLEVDGKALAGMPLERLVGLVHGEPGTTVKIKVVRQGNQQLDFTITRAKVDVPDVTWRMLPGLPIAHIAIQNFGRKVHDQLKEALDGAREKKAKALILDLRGNTGGIKDMAVAVSSEFLKDGAVLIERDAKNNRKTIPVRPGGAATDIPVCVIINEASFSSAEIFAGALQDHARGKLVGARTRGLGTVLNSFPLSDGSHVLLAVSEWLTPNGRQIWRQGISPDITVASPDPTAVLLPEAETELDAAALAKSGDKQLLKAVEILKVQIK